MAHYFSPDCGRFEHIGNKFYFEDGDITDDDDTFIRMMPVDDGVEFSKWTDEERSKVKAEWKKQRAEWDKENRLRDQKIRKLRASAKKKLTEEEFALLE